MRSSPSSSFAKFFLICCFAILAVSSAFGVTPVAAGFAIDPDHVSVSPEGCRNNGGITLQNNGGTFICTPDTAPPSDAPYTAGDLGKNWAELDFVPFKLTTSSASGSTTPIYNVIIAGDYQQGGPTGYDFITVPILDPNLPSDSSCKVADANAGDANNGLEIVTGATGGTDTTIYRTLTITQNAGTTCYFAYDQRLAIGSHLFNGSNLQAYTFLSADFKTGKQTIPIPVKPCNNQPGCVPTPAPQSISKDMSAKVPVTTMWSLSGSGPNSVSADTCDQNQLTQSPLKFTISWSATQSSSGGVNIVTHVFATNPAAVPIQVQITDRIYPGIDSTQDNDPFIVPPGTNAALDTTTGSFVTVPANTQNQLVLTHSYNDPSGSVGTGYNDIAVGSYEDADGNEVVGNTFAQASATAVSSSPTNTTATVNNQESITGTGLNFSTDSFTPSDPSADGAFDNSYLAGTQVPLNFSNPVSWTSISQDATTVENNNGESVVFSKSLYLPFATAVSGTLSDSATLTDSGSNKIDMTPSLSVSVTGAPQLSLEIDKTLNVAVGTDQTFTFEVKDSQNNKTPAGITIKAGETSGSTTVSGLSPDKYTVTEDANSLWTNDGPHSIDLSAASDGTVSCTGNTVTFKNTIVNSDLTVSKTATPAFTRTYTWGITKAVDQTTIATSGAGAKFNYTVSVTHDSGTDSGWQVTGKITVSNPNQDDFTGVSVTDAINDGGSCTVTNGANVTVPAGGSVQLDYTCTYAAAQSPSSFTNTGTATWDSSYGTPHTTGSGTAAGDFSTTTPTIVDGSVTVTDTFGGSLGTVSYTDASPKSFQYSHTFNGDTAGTCTKHDNTATFTTSDTKTTGSDSKEVKVCVGADLTVSKTALVSVPTYSWGITKGVSPTGTVQASGSVTLNYTVTAKYTKIGSWTLAGTVTVTNPNDWESISGINVTDAIDNNGSCTVTSGTNQTLTAGQSKGYSYSCTYSSTPTPTSGYNTGTASWTPGTTSNVTPHGTATGKAAYSFSPLTSGPTTVTITDAFNGGNPTTLGVINALTNAVTSVGNGVTVASTPPSFKFTYSHVVNVTVGACSPISNTAKVVDTSLVVQATATATVTVCNTKTGALTMGFWQGPQGQKVIGTSSTAGSCSAVIGYLKSFAPLSDLSATNCKALNTYISNVVNAANSSGGGGLMLKGQMMATALTAFYGPATGQGTVQGFGNIWILLNPIKGTEDVRSAFISYNKAIPHLWGEQVSQMLLDASANWTASNCSPNTGACTLNPYLSKIIMVYASDAFAYINQGQANISAP